MMGGFLLILGLAGCGGSSSSSAPIKPQAAPQLYFTPAVTGEATLIATTYSFDDTATPTFSQITYTPRTQPGPQILEAGTFTVAQRGLRSLNISTVYVWDPANLSAYTPTTPTTSGGSFALELAGQAGGLTQLVGQPVAPLVAATECPNFSSAQSYQFVTIPEPLLPAGAGPTQDTWDPTTQTAYGTVEIGSSGNTVNFQNIQQFTLPGTLVQSSPSSATGSCAPTYFGNTIVAPGQAVIGNPGVGGSGGNTVTSQATIGIGPSGLLVEDSGGTNVLGAGTGAVGLPVPANAPLDTTAVTGAQYLGFIYGAGVYINTSPNTSGWSSHLASFGFPASTPAVPAGCPSTTANPSTSIYGGDFPQAKGQDNPSASSDGFGNCDFIIDLGSQDPANNGRYPYAKVWVGANYAANPTCASTCADYSFSAVAIAAQLGGKYAIFLIGVDSSQPWSIYLLQSN
jgi:hypothetical protein